MQFSFTLEDPPLLSEIRARLLAVFGPQRDDVRLDPLSQLVLALISWETKDEAATLAFDRLLDKYESWEVLSRAAPEEIEDVIRPVQHADVKAVYLPQALRMVKARVGDLDLHFLADLEEEPALQWLRRLRGVRTKTAATILNFSTLRKRTLPVDRHMLRVGKRVGFLPEHASYDTGYDMVMRRVPDHWDAETLYEFHWLVKYLSQKICTHATPDCSHCPLRDFCPSAFLGPGDGPSPTHCAAAAPASSVG